ncbi:hypothetical protein EDC19_1123 [Natranaerovirga hydrolytica]|uniref:Uncharacterized protein n=1 Tax=Natranaerovirga hydrolytica TaxID=680378 RepID=A0A4R1N170_9FIRM|nr:hypothetical protein [Natranaerovirga hydrolytica]TCK98690.1 hypothetical protein EDC19_1123 [Natranaerovirga hydrolytica]
MSSLTTCSWCNNNAGEMVGQKPCHFCKENMSQGIAVIITSKDDPAFKNFFDVKDVFSHMGKYLEEWFVVNKKDFKKYVKKNLKDNFSKDEMKDILKKGFFWLQESEDNTIANIFPNDIRVFNYSKKNSTA